MSEKRASLEVIAPTVEEALAKGLSDLGLAEDEVELEVLDEGSRGLFGLRARQARIRLTIKSAPKEEVEWAASFEGQPAKAARSPASSSPAAQAQSFETPPTVEAARPQPAPAKTTSSPDARQSEDLEAEDLKEEFLQPGNVDEFTLQVARETVDELLQKMKVKAQVTARFGVAEDARSKVPILVDIKGNDLSILIGRAAETLNALQYIASLIIAKELGRSIPVVIDVEGYRQRREQQIRQLARRMADQAIKTGRRQVLEPMPANERRLIHLELREHPQVMTESIGEEPRRKVTILLKE
jgi:spoIIIJ-associated protein